MKLNKSQSYAEIFGHDRASFEQNGILFDAEGLMLDEIKPKSKQEKLTLKPKSDLPADVNQNQLDNARIFLENILRGGPIDKSVIFKETENNNQRWDTVKAAFVNIKGKETKQGTATMWSLNLE